MARRSNTSSPSLLPTTNAGASTFGSRNSALPRSGMDGSLHNSGTRRGSLAGGLRVPRFVRRILRPPTLDFETAIWEILYLVIAPRKVYKSLYYHKQTKNTWARDDPSFVILLSVFLCITAVAWGLAYKPGFGSIIKLMLYMVVVDFLATGVVIATFGWLFANRFLRQRAPRAGPMMAMGGEGELEWAYCFDVHCNSFLMIWLLLYIVQFILLPVLNRPNWISLVLGNTLYLVALSCYCVISFLGYSNMPFLEHTELLLFPIPIFAILWIVSLFGFSIVRTMVHLYFG